MFEIKKVGVDKYKRLLFKNGNIHTPLTQAPGYSESNIYLLLKESNEEVGVISISLRKILALLIADLIWFLFCKFNFIETWFDELFNFFFKLFILWVDLESIAIFAPLFAKASHKAAPSPFDAPVTTTLLPLNSLYYMIRIIWLTPYHSCYT